MSSTRGSIWLRLGFALVPIVASLGVSALLVMAVGSDPIAVVEAVWTGAFRNSTSFAGVINFWLPLTLCALGLVVTFTAGLWNIGVEGQMMMGAIFASWAAQFAVSAADRLRDCSRHDRRRALGWAGRAAQDQAGRS